MLTPRRLPGDLGLALGSASHLGGLAPSPGPSGRQSLNPASVRGSVLALTKFPFYPAHSRELEWEGPPGRTRAVVGFLPAGNLGACGSRFRERNPSE